MPYQIHLALSEWQTGHHVPGLKFSADSFSGIYTDHVRFLKHIKHENLEAYHLMMTSIFSLAYAHCLIYIPSAILTKAYLFKISDFNDKV